MPAKSTSLQDMFLNALRKQRTPVTMFLVKGVKLQGVVTWFDNFSILLRRDGQTQLVYKHAISTIMPSMRMDLTEFYDYSQQTNRAPSLQDIFLNAVRESDASVTMFLVNGVMLQGNVAAYDLFCMLLEREGMAQLAYKHAVSTVQPSEELDLQAASDNDE